jgi:hypothetical protein
VVEPPAAVPVVPEKPKVVTTTVDSAADQPVLEKPPVATVKATPAVVAAPVPVLVPEKPATVAVVATPALAAETVTPIVNLGKYNPATSLDGKTTFGEQVGSSYAQLLQPSPTSASTLVIQQNPVVPVPEPDKQPDKLSVSAAPANNTDTSKTSTVAPLIAPTTVPTTLTTPVIVPTTTVPMTLTTPLATASLAPVIRPLAPLASTVGESSSTPVAVANVAVTNTLAAPSSAPLLSVPLNVGVGGAVTTLTPTPVSVLP